jgi:PilZ domain-containing protein
VGEVIEIRQCRLMAVFSGH